METSNNEKLGGGIITLCILTLIGFAISLLGYTAMLFGRDALIDLYNSMGIDATALIPDTSILIVELIVSIAIGVSAILILMKKSVGVYAYFVAEIIAIIESIVFNGFSIGSLILSLIFPILMAIFISKKKEIFGLGSN